MLILVEGPDPKFVDQMVAALEYELESAVTLDGAFEVETQTDPESFAVTNYVIGAEPSVILTRWHWATLVAYQARGSLPFSWQDFQRIETHLGRRGCLAVYVERSVPDLEAAIPPLYRLIQEGSKLPFYVWDPVTTRLSVALREVVALGQILTDAPSTSKAQA